MAYNEGRDARSSRVLVVRTFARTRGNNGGFPMGSERMHSTGLHAFGRITVVLVAAYACICTGVARQRVLQGDANLDGVVDLQDVIAFSIALESVTEWSRVYQGAIRDLLRAADLDRDGQVGNGDIEPISEAIRTALTGCAYRKLRPHCAARTYARHALQPDRLRCCLTESKLRSRDGHRERYYVLRTRPA